MEDHRCGLGYRREDRCDHLAELLPIQPPWMFILPLPSGDLYAGGAFGPLLIPTSLKPGMGCTSYSCCFPPDRTAGRGLARWTLSNPDLNHFEFARFRHGHRASDRSGHMGRHHVPDGQQQNACQPQPFDGANRSASDTHSLPVLSAVMKTKGVGILTYQADCDNVRRDAGDWREGVRTTAGSPSRQPPDERTCRDDQE